MTERIVQLNKKGWCEIQRWRWWFPFWIAPPKVNTEPNYFSCEESALQALLAERTKPFTKKVLWKDQ